MTVKNFHRDGTQIDDMTAVVIPQNIVKKIAVIGARVKEDKSNGVFGFDVLRVLADG